MSTTAKSVAKKGKAPVAPQAEVLLDDTFMRELEQNGLSGADIVLPSKKRKNPASNRPEPRQLTKAEEKKLLRIQEEKRKKAERAALFASLNKSQISASEFSLMKSTKSIGQAKETLKQRVRHDYYSEKHGLTKPKEVAASDSDSSEEYESDSESDAEESDHDQPMETTEPVQTSSGLTNSSDTLDFFGNSASTAPSVPMSVVSKAVVQVSKTQEVAPKQTIISNSVTVAPQEIPTSTPAAVVAAPKVVALPEVDFFVGSHGKVIQTAQRNKQKRARIVLQLPEEAKRLSAQLGLSTQTAVAAADSADESASNQSEDSEGDDGDDGSGSDADSQDDSDASDQSSDESGDESGESGDSGEEDGSGSGSDDGSGSESSDSDEPTLDSTLGRHVFEEPVREYDIMDPSPSGIALASAGLTANYAHLVEDTEELRAAREALQAAAPKIRGAKVKVDRDPELQRARMLLPVCAEEQVIMETVEQNDVCIICGETGSGKTTQVPQFLYEAGYASEAHPGLIGVTQPRRVAAVSMAKRVAVELNCKNDSEVCYQIRYDSRVGEDTKVKFMTDGILLKEIQQDFLLRKYSVLILDEAHERNLNTDVLIGLLSRILPLRNQLARQQNDANSVDIQNVMSAVNATEAHAAVTAASTAAKMKSKIRLTPLKLIIMSATLRVSDFVDNKRLFAVPPPVVHIAARQYPVTIHFNKRTPIDDYLPETLKKIIKIHRKLPPGGILVFLTGRREIEDVCSKLRKKFGKLGTLVDPRAPVTASTNAASAPRKPMSKVEKLLDTDEPESELVAKVESKLDELDAFGGGADATEDAEAAQFDIDASTRANEADEQLSSDDEDLDHDEEEEEEDEFPDLTENETTMRVRVLPLYSLLGTQQQMQVFDSVDASKERLVVVATNVAETSLTIPGIKYVVDAGREKSRTFDRMSGLSQFKVEWVSQASAQQRAGRAGRTGPGHCYRLFSSAVFNDQFEKFASPEITRLPLEGTVLHLKSMGIEDVARFPFPTPPDAAGLQSAIKTLTMLSALTAPPASVLSMAQAKLLSGKSSDGISMGVVNDVDQAASIAIEVATSQKITQIGRSLAVLPVAPRFGKMLALGNQGGCLHFAVAVVASLCVEELFFSLDTDMTADENNIQEMEVDAGQADQDGSLKKSKDKEAARRADAADKEARKARLTALRVAKQKFSSSHSDLLTNLRVIGTFDHVPMDERVAFCQQNCIILKSMLEVQELRSQLTRVIAQKFASNLKPAALSPPSPAQERLLCQIVASGLVDHVARKWPRDLRVVLDDGTEFSGGGGAYQCNAVPGPVYLHPSTALFSVGNQPDLCVYVELVRTTKRTYIKGVTSIQPEWLPNLAPSECSDRLLDAPSPKYDMEQDRIKCWVDCTFGPNRWPLPRRLVDFPDANSNVAISAETTTFQRLVGGSNNFRQRLFAQFLLEGQVCKGFAKFRSYLNTKPASLLSSYAASQKVTSLLAALTKSKVDSLAKLKSKWSVDKKFLLEEFLLWVQPAIQNQVKQAWPPM